MKGLELFNHQEYFECHEVIEDLWLETPEADSLRDLYKGVIQAAAAIYQWDRGILTGARGLYRSAIGYLEKYQPETLGLNVKDLLGKMKEFCADLDQWDGESPLPRDPKKIIRLEYKKI